MASTVVLPPVAEAAASHAYEAMPNFVGMGQSAVHYEMYRAQLYYKTQGPGADSPRWARVVGEIPAAGTEVPTLSTVILEVTTTPLVVAVVHRAVVTVAKKSVTKKPVTKKPVTKKPAAGKPVARLLSVTRTRRSTTLSAPRHKRTVVDFKVGIATWYYYFPGRCATWYLPMGTRIIVEDLDTGKVISCLVTDREGARGDHAVDLSETQFAQLAPLSEGVLRVRVTW